MRDEHAQGSCGMSAFDAFLYRGDDDPHTRALFAVACVLDRSPGRRRFMAAFDRASRLVPRLRQRVVAPMAPLFLPWWVVDPEFDLGFHLRFGRLPAPGSMPELLDAAQAEVTAPLDADRPLWEAVLLDDRQRRPLRIAGGAGGHDSLARQGTHAAGADAATRHA
jgi:diacylglycerol O-acyltransferase